RIGDTIVLSAPPSAVSYAAAGGKKEREGPLAKQFDVLTGDAHCGEKTWEKAESSLARQCLDTALHKGGLSAKQLNAVLAGDLQCQCTASSYAMRGIDAPYLGLYGACSTMTEALGLAACMVSAGAWRCAAAMSSSHFCAAERQFRTPLEYGGKRAPTSQWTVTGAGAAILAPQGGPPYVKCVTFGRVRDFAITDINNMGAAMAPAAAQTLVNYLADQKESPDHFDAIYTGDLGFVGRTLLLELLRREGVEVKNHRDCGLMVYDRDTQDVQAGGSGAGCSASVLCCEVLPKLARGELSRVLFLSTGALMSQTTFLQGESIPGVAHLVELSSTKETER
ncbi:MAG: stage V sporulation protein AD, partial [Ruthenibacterium sp.]